MENRFRIALVVGSVRKDRQGIKVARWLTEKVRERGHAVDVVDPMEKPLPFVDKMYKEFEEGKAPVEMQEIHEIFDRADGFLFVTPEYNRSTSATMKNTLDTFQWEFFFKPAALASYSDGGFGGVRSVQHLQNIAIELGMTPTPIAFHVPKVDKTFEEPGQPIEKKREGSEKRVARFLEEFEWYLRALKREREIGTPY
jgi:NAD(P)H-dependent FMN reductase